MSGHDRNRPIADWDPRSADVLQDPIAAYDAMRRRCPVAWSEYLSWSVFRHGDTVRALDDPVTFSNEVSVHLSVPNGMDPPVHTAWRRLIDPYFSAERMAAIEPACRELARAVLGQLPADRDIEAMSELAEVYALQAQSAFLDWPAEWQEPLRRWVRRNHEATLSGSRDATAAVALEFDQHIRAVLDRRRRDGTGHDDVASRLLREQIEGRVLTDAELVSILRNWTVGELSTIAASVGILLHYLAAHPEVLAAFRADATRLVPAIDEILRIHPPLIASRRRTTCPVELGGRHLPAGQRVTLMWAAANRDEAVFGDPDAFRPDRNARDNLLYGTGIHACPGAPLARLELRVLLQALLEGGYAPVLATDRPPRQAVYPASGFATLHLRLRRR